MMSNRWCRNRYKIGCWEIPFIWTTTGRKPRMIVDDIYKCILEMWFRYHDPIFAKVCFWSYIYIHVLYVYITGHQGVSMKRDVWLDNLHIKGTLQSLKPVKFNPGVMLYIVAKISNMNFQNLEMFCWTYSKTLYAEYQYIKNDIQTKFTWKYVHQDKCLDRQQGDDWAISREIALIWYAIGPYGW